MGRQVPRRGPIVAAALSGALVLAGCGGTSAPWPRSTSATSSGPTSTPTTALPPGFTTATLAIVRCPTTFAAGTPTTTAPLPTSAAVVVPADEAGDLVVYGDDAGLMALVGPSTWTCRGSYGADGSGGLSISPVGETVPSNPDTGWQLPASSSDEAIVGYETGGSPVEGAGLACPLFKSAAAVVEQDLGRGCAVTRPPEETSTRTGSSEGRLRGSGRRGWGRHSLGRSGSGERRHALHAEAKWRPPLLLRRARSRPPDTTCAPRC